MNQYYVWAYTNTGSGCSAVNLFLQCTSENQGEKKTQNYIANTYHQRKLLLSGGFIVKKLFFQYPHRVFILLIVRVFFEMLTFMHNRILTLIRLGKPL